MIVQESNTIVVAEHYTTVLGNTIDNLHVQYQTWGAPNSDYSNTVWVLHALTGNSNAAEWWPEVVGKGKPFDPAKHFIICANMIGSCYGSSRAIDSKGSAVLLTTSDVVNAFILLRKKLGIASIGALIGGSMGGQQALEWALVEPEVVQRIISIAANAVHSPWAIAWNETQRMAIAAAINPEEGMEAARAMAMLSYRSHLLYNAKQAHEKDTVGDYRVVGYQRYQGKKLRERFDAQAYVTLTHIMDSHNIGRNRGGIGNALRSIQQPALIVGIPTDLLFPESEQQFIAEQVPNASYKKLQSVAGHDAFLLQQHTLAKIISAEKKVVP